jgi:arabinan endo-1,5-alpha-L-arabinosidase
MELSGDIQHVHDPALIVHDGTWHLFSTGTGIPYRTSADGITWKYIREVLSEVPTWGKEAVSGVKNPWAPDISFFNGRFYLYYSLSTFGSQNSAIGLATAEHPGGPWRDDGLVFQSRRGDPYNCIDPNAFIDSKNQLWLTFGSFWKGIFVVPLDKTTGKPEKNAVPRCIAARPEGTAIEAPFVIERGGFVYLFAAIDFCCRGPKSTYKTVVGRARSIGGPFLDKNKVPLTEGGGTILTVSGPRWRGPGHPGIVSSGKQDFLAIHAYDAENNGFPTLRLAPIVWKRGWPEVAPLEKPAPGKEIVGVWEQRVGRGAAFQLTLGPDGSADASTGRPNARPAPGPTWEREGSTGFIVRWPASDAPGGFWLDRLRLSRDRTTYVGTNQKGQKITGVRVS